MSTHSELSQIVRQPMHEWWRTTGAWLLLAMGMLWVLAEGIVLYIRPWLPPDFSQRNPQLIILMGIAGLAGMCAFLILPTVWLIASMQVIKFMPASGLSLDQPRVAQALYLILAKQGAWPFVFFVLLRATNYAVTRSHFGDGNWYWIWNMIDGTGQSLEFTLRLLPGMFVALGLLVITQRIRLSVVLLTAHLLANVAWSALTVFYEDWSYPSWLEWSLGVAAGTAAIYIMFYGLMAKRDSTWRSAYWIVIGSLVLSPIFAVVYDAFPSWTLLRLYQVVLAPGYFFDGYSNPALVGLIWHGGIVLFIYLLLGRPWRKTESATPAPDASPALV